MKTHSKPHQVMIGRSALLSDSLLWSSDKTGRNPCGPVAIRIRQREFGQFGIMSIQRSSGGVLPLKRLEFGATARQPSADSILYSEMSRF